MKRKASALEDPIVVGDWATHGSPTTATTSPESTHTSCNSWTILPVPYFNTRTRKRYRDGRPDEATIHGNTIAKLFEAQHKIHEEEIAEQQRSRHVGSYLMSLDTFEPVAAQDATTEPTQKSIHSFFGGGANLHRPQRLVHHDMFQLHNNAESIPACEDCSSNLCQNNDTNMDVDWDSMNWSCARCSKRVCDTCAVRGNDRICLECAMPGGGSG